MKLTIRDKEPESYGYTQNGEPIDYDTVMELYRIAENEILPKSDLAKQCNGDCTIDELTFEYYQTGTAFGAKMNYTIDAGIKTSGGDLLNIYDFVTENIEEEMHWDYNDPDVRVDIHMEIGVNTDNCDTVVNDIYVYRKGRYSEQESNILFGCFNFEEFCVYMNSLANQVAEEIHGKLSNI